MAKRNDFNRQPGVYDGDPNEMGEPLPPEPIESGKDLTNYDKLQKNKKEVLEFAKEITITKNPSIKQNIAERRYEVRELFEKGDLSAAIKKLDELKDNILDISWHKRIDSETGFSVIVRDARSVTDNISLLKEDAPEKYAMQVLNQTRAAYDLIDQSNLTSENKKSAKEKLTFIANDALNRALDTRNDALQMGEVFVRLNSETIRDYNTQIVHVLKTCDITQPAKKLKFASEIATLKDNHSHIVTLTTAEDTNNVKHTVYEAEIMLNGLTETLRNQYERIALSKPGRECGVAWFDKMDPYKQDLLRPAAWGIASGKKVIPAQLLSDIVGVRNAYQKVTAISSPNELQDPKILAETAHCGAPATKIKNISKEDRQAIVDENIRQLKSFAPPGVQTNLINLTSITPLNVRNENSISDQLQKSKVENVKKSALPINRWRLLGGGRNTIQFEENLRHIGKEIKIDGLESVSSYLQNGKSRVGNFIETITFGAYKTHQTRAMEALNDLINPPGEYLQLAKDLRAAVIARSLIDSSNIFARSNVNLDLTKEMEQVKDSVKTGALNKLLGSEFAEKYPSTVIFCKSGKDRTGYMLFNSTRELINLHLGLNSEDKQSKNNFNSLVAGNHTQEMAGVQGGTTGCHGIKTSFEFRFSKLHSAANKILNQKTSKFNSSIKTLNGKEAEKAIKESKKPPPNIPQTNGNEKASPSIPHELQKAAALTIPTSSPSTKLARLGKDRPKSTFVPNL